jgi:uncharacterized protein YbbK (DUF523 family)
MEKMKVLISACLMGEVVRYDGQPAGISSAFLEDLKRSGRLFPFCPEVAAGLPVPRPPCEICGGTGKDVLRGKARVMTKTGDDATRAFILGARMALESMAENDLRVAILKRRSPSCGSDLIYDGSFSGNLIPGRGVTASYLEEVGIPVFNEANLEEVRRMCDLTIS